MKLSSRKTFTRKQLAKRWKCDISLIDGCIEDGRLREGLNTSKAGYSHLRKLWYLVMDADWFTEQLLSTVKKEKTLSEFIGSHRKEIASCPQYLYMSPQPNALGKIKDPNLFSPGSVFFSFCCVPIRYFYDLEGKVLIPVKEVEDESYVFSPHIWKRRFRNFIIPLEEALRFEIEYNIGENEQDVSPAPDLQDSQIPLTIHRQAFLKRLKSRLIGYWKRY